MSVILRLPEVIRRTGLKRTAIYERIKIGEFRKISLGARAVGFLESEVEDWISERQRQNQSPEYASTT